MWIGVNSNRNFSGFIVPKHYPLHGTEARVDENGNRIVSTNTPAGLQTSISKSATRIWFSTKRTIREEFPKYDNYNAIEVSKTADIPMRLRRV